MGRSQGVPPFGPFIPAPQTYMITTKLVRETHMLNTHHIYGVYSKHAIYDRLPGLGPMAQFGGLLLAIFDQPATYQWGARVKLGVHIEKQATILLLEYMGVGKGEWSIAVLDLSCFCFTVGQQLPWFMGEMHVPDL